MTYEIILNYSTSGVNVSTNCDDEKLFELLHDDEIFQDLIDQLMSRFGDVARDNDSD